MKEQQKPAAGLRDIFPSNRPWVVKRLMKIMEEVAQRKAEEKKKPKQNGLQTKQNVVQQAQRNPATPGVRRMKEITDIKGYGMAEKLAEQMRTEWKRTRPKMYRELQKSGDLEPLITARAKRIADATLDLYEQILEKNPAPAHKSLLERAAHLNWALRTAEELMRNQVLLPPEPPQE